MYPRLIELGPITLHTYGVLLASAYLVSIGVAARLAASEKISSKRVWDLGFIIILSAIAGAKLLLVLTDLEGYVSQPSRFLSFEFWQAGGVYYGGFLGAIAGTAIYIRRSPDLQFWKVADAAAPAVALGQSIGRLGCFAAGCDYGKPADLPWAVTFTSEYAHRFIGVPINVPLHPAQLYESFAAFLIFLLLFWFYRARRAFTGQVFALYLVFYGMARFFLEFYRGDADRGFVFGGALSTSQFISLLIVPAGVALYVYLLRREPSGSRRG